MAVLHGGRIFACRHCNRAAYRCQREPDDDRASRRAETIRRRLGWEPGFLNGKLCNLYRFTDKDCWEWPKLGLPACKASKDWLAWTSVREAKAAVTAAHLAAKRPTDQNASKLQKTKRTASKSVAEGPFVATKSEQDEGGKLQILKRRVAA